MPTSPLRRWFESLRRPPSTYDRTVADVRRELDAADTALRRMVDETATFKPRGPMFPPDAAPDVPDNERARELEVQRRQCEAEYLAAGTSAA